MRRADRLFQIVQYLRDGRLTTAAILAEKLEVSERTIYRDIADLIGTGVPIDGEAGVGKSALAEALAHAHANGPAPLRKSGTGTYDGYTCSTGICSALRSPCRLSRCSATNAVMSITSRNSSPASARNISPRKPS